MQLFGRPVIVDLQRMELLANFLRRGPRAEKAYSEPDLVWRGIANSIRSREITDCPVDVDSEKWTRALDTAYAVARLGLVSMGEHELCMARIIIDPDLGAYGLLGTEVCCRSAIETGARAWWLLDSTISARQRLIRYFVEDFDNAVEADKLEARIRGLPIKRYRQLSASAEDRCSEVGLSFVRNKKSNSYAVEGVSRQTATEAVTQFIGATPYFVDKVGVYSLLSGATHGAAYSLMRSYVFSHHTDNDEAEYLRFVDHRLIEASVGLTMTAHAALLQKVVELTGWERYRAESLAGNIHRILSEGPR